MLLLAVLHGGGGGLGGGAEGGASGQAGAGGAGAGQLGEGGQALLALAVQDVLPHLKQEGGAEGRRRGGRGKAVEGGGSGTVALSHICCQINSAVHTQSTRGTYTGCRRLPRLPLPLTDGALRPPRALSMKVLAAWSELKRFTCSIRGGGAGRDDAVTGDEARGEVWEQQG